MVMQPYSKPRTSVAELKADARRATAGAVEGSSLIPSKANWGSSRDLNGHGPGVRKFEQLARVDAPLPRSWAISCRADSRPGESLARIRWGSGGISQEVVMSIVNGFTITLVGSSVSLEACVDGPAIGTDTNIMGSVSADEAGRPLPISMQVVAAVAPAAVAIIDLPPYARRVKVIPTSTSVAGNGFTVSEETWSLNFDPNEKMDWEPLTGGGSAGLSITNNSADPVDFSIFCELSI